jgi:hypothetical protein
MTTYAGMALWSVCRHFGFEMIFISVETVRNAD